MTKGRLEAFSDGVIAIIITIMVLELKVPHGADLTVLTDLIPVFFSYVLSFVYVGIYWNNHHHLFHAVQKINGATLWANLHLLFWLSLIPFSTGWMGENHFAPNTAALYGINLLCCALAFTVLSRCLIKLHGKQSVLAQAMGRDRKGKLSLVLYIIGVPCSLFHPAVAYALYTTVAIIWLIPDTRIEKALPHS